MNNTKPKKISAAILCAAMLAFSAPKLPGGFAPNWWCVVYPQASPQTAVEETDDTDGGYVIKFRIVELWEKLMAAIFGD